MPTKRRRHAVTETPRVEAALAVLRRELGSEHVDLAELVVLGAEQKAKQVRAENAGRAELRRQLAEQIRTRTVPVDAEAAAEVRRRGWARR